MLKTAVIGKIANGTTQLSRIMVMSGDRIVLVDATTGQPPKKVTTKMVNKDLHIFAEGATEPSVILNDYASYEQTVQISGIDSGGAYVNYGTAEAGSMELGTATPITSTPAPIMSTSAWWGVGILAVAGGVAAAAGGGGGGDSSTPPPSSSDTIAPPVITIVATDDIVNASESINLVISGIGEIGATVKLAVTNQTAVVDSSGNWSITVANTATSFGQGVETLSVTQTDLAGNISVAGTRAISVDTVAPSAPLIGGVAINDIVNLAENANLLISGTGEIGATVTLELGVTDQTAVVDGSGNWSITVADAAATFGQGTETLSITQEDSAGNISVAGTRAISVDTIAAAPIINGPIATDNIINSAENPNLIISGIGEVGAIVTLAVVNQTAIVDSTGGWSITLPDTAAIFGQGAEVLSVTQTDIAGNTSAAGTYSIFIDTVAPQFVSAQTSSVTESITLTYDSVLEAVDMSNVGNFSIEINGIQYTLGGTPPTPGTPTAPGVLSVGMPDSTHIVLTLAGIDILATDTVRIAYTDVTGDATSAIQDLAGNDATSFPWYTTNVI